MSSEMPARLLRLLALLQGRREWSGHELAVRLGVTTRTLRRDVERLRDLGYPVIGTTGRAGGYRLASGRNLPPLLLADDEAVALAVALRTAASAGVAGIDEAAVRALAKLEQVLPPRLRQRVSSVGEVTAGVRGQGGPPVDPALLATLAAACRDHELVTFDYRRRDGAHSSRRVEPYHLVATYGRWHLLGYDTHRGGWRIFRLDRLTALRPVRHRFAPRPAPDPDPAGYVARALVSAPYRYVGTATVAAPAEVVLARLPAPVPGKVVASDSVSCTVRLGADRLGLVAGDIVALLAAQLDDADPGLDGRVADAGVEETPSGELGAAEMRLDAPAELLDQLDALARRLLALTARARVASAR